MVIYYLRKTLAILPIVAFFLVSSCNSDDLEFTIGGDFIDEDVVVAQSDTFTIRMSTVKVDSLITSGFNTILVGNYHDEFVGDIVATSYMQIGVSSNEAGSLGNGTFSSTEDYYYDSICLVLNHNGYYYGDTNVSQTLKVCRLTESFDDLEQNSFYQNNDLKYDTTNPLGELTYRSFPNYDPRLYIRLDDDWGKELFAYLLEDNEWLDNNTKFESNVLKGLALVPNSGDNTTPILGYEVNDTALVPSVRIYYRKSGLFTQELQYTFPLTDAGYQFNGLSVGANENGLMEELGLDSQRDAIMSTETNDLTYVQSGVGLMTRIDLPYLGDLLNLSKPGKIVSAVLQLEPAKGTYTKETLPSSLVLCSCNEHNKLGSAITNYDGSSISQQFNYDALYNKDTYYSFDITWYMQNLFRDGFYENENGIMVLMPGSVFSTTFEKVLLGGEDHPENEPKLVINYFTYE